MLSDIEIQEIVKFYEQPLTECWATAFDDYANKYDDTRHIHTPRSRASLMHDHCIHHIQQLFSGNSFVSFPPKKRGLFVVELSGEPLGIKGSVLARFKKLNDKMLTSSILTGQAKAFNEQRPLEIPIQPNLFGFPLTVNQENMPHINIGYLPNKFWLSLEAVYATMPDGNHSLRWFVKLSDDGGMSQTPIIDMPIVTPETQVKRVKPKSARQDEKKENSN